MTIYEMKVARDLKTITLTKSHFINIELKTNNKQVLDYWNDIIMDLLSDEKYLNYLHTEKKDENEEQ